MSHQRHSPAWPAARAPVRRPPEHDLIDVGLRLSWSDACDLNPVVTVQLFADEDDEEPTGDGTHSPDAKPGHTFGPLQLPSWLRAERKGDGDGRVYLIRVTARDASGNGGHAWYTVVVPTSQSPADIDAVNAQAAAAATYGRNTGNPPPGFFAVGDGATVGPKQ